MPSAGGSSQVGPTSSAAAPSSVETTLLPQPSSVAEARREVRELLRTHGRSDLEESAALLTSELVTNAMLHAGTDIDLVARFDGDVLEVEVADGSTHLPSRRRYAATAGTGRGLLMLESMVDDWGVTLHAHGKTVWFRLSGVDADLPVVEPLGSAGPVTDGPGRARRRDHVSVQLQNMPLLLHAAWQEHAEALLREYLLASLDEDGVDGDGSDSDPVQVHADATDAIAVLEEHVPHATVTISPEKMMGEAVEPNVSATVLELPVPVASVSHFATLDRAIEAALDLSREGLVLTPPSQPEVQAFRRWLCRQVLSQAEGARPVPWRVPEGGVEELPALAGWDPRTVTEAADGMIAADTTSRIRAVSREAAEILGYDDPGELVGRRIVSIIPERYRQAHVAGFTMYLLVGRRPMFDHEVEVPALRRDGTEVPIVLTVRAPDLGAGDVVLLAQLRRAD